MNRLHEEEHNSHNIRRIDRALSEEESKKLLHRCEYGILSTADTSGAAYGVPLNYAYDEKNNLIYFHGANCLDDLQSSHKLRNFSQNNASACFTVVGEIEILSEKFSTRYESAMAFGKMHICQTNEEKLHGLLALIQKYSPEFGQKGEEYAKASVEKNLVVVFALKIDCITGKARKKK